MMDFIHNDNSGTDSGKSAADIPVTAQEKFVHSVYSSVDEAAVSGLDLLLRTDGIVPRCKLGCSCCCRYHILNTIAEAHALAQYVKRELSAWQIGELRMRTQQWHEFDNSRPGRYPLADIDEWTKFAEYDHRCPLLVNDACSVYPVRPVVCRTHFVRSHPRFCCAANDPESTEDAPVVLTSIVKATSPFSMAIRDHIEKAGLDFSRSRMLLPHWLAAEMGWDFDTSTRKKTETVPRQVPKPCADSKPGRQS